MMKLSLILVLASCLAVTLAEPKVSQRGLIHEIRQGVAGPNPYIFLTVPKGRSQALVQGFEVIDEDDDEDDAVDMHNDDQENDDDDEDQLDEDEEDTLPKNDEDSDDDEEEILDVMNMNVQMRKKPQHQIKNAKPTQMMVSREHAGAIMVPDEIIEIEGQSVIDEKTGKPALLLPRAILDTIPDGSVVALMERSVEPSAEEQERANRVIVRRRRKGARRNIKRRRGASNNRRRVNNQGGNKRRRINRINKVRVNRRGGNRVGNRRRRVGNNNRRQNNRRRVVYQG